MTVKLAGLSLVLAVSTARAECPSSQASCILHEEGAALLVEGHFEQAAAKFRASIAAAPSARAYLGYAQAVEGLGQVALAYESMLEAKRLSELEVAAAKRGDVDSGPRSERIKYKLAELASAVGFVRLELPDGVAPERLASVQREHEGDVADPLSHPIPVAPGHQRMIAMLRDGSKIEFEATVAAGFEGRLVIPMRATVTAVQPDVRAVPEPARPRAAARRDRGLAVEVFGLPGAVRRVGFGFGAGVRGELVLGATTITARASYFFHPDNQAALPGNGPGSTQMVGVAASELQATVGANLWIRRPLYASAELGVQHFDEHSDDFVNINGTKGAETGVSYGLVGVGVGVRFGRFDVRLTELIGLALDDTGGFDPTVPDTSFRILISVGFQFLP